MYSLKTYWVLDMSFTSLIRQKPGEIKIFGTFIAKSEIVRCSNIFNFGLYFTENVGTYFGMYEKRRPLPI